MFHEKKVVILLDFVQITPSPQVGQLAQLFLNAKNVNLRNIQNNSLNKDRLFALWVMYAT